MKISQRILILIAINIFALFCMAVVISLLSAIEQKYYVQSNKILDFKYTLSEKQNREKQIFTDKFDPLSMEQLSFELLSKFHDIDTSLLEQSREQYGEIALLISTREGLSKSLVDIPMGNKIQQLYDEIDLIDDQIDLIDDQIELMVDNIRNETIRNYKKREDQELFAIISGLLFITLFSITATAILGKSIIVPIEQLRSYVLSTDISNMDLHKNRSEIHEINAKKHVEIHQLAEAYIKLEKALFSKMSELEERSENLSLELKERRKTERKLLKTETHLNNIIQSLNSIVITADKTLKLIHFNKLADELAIGKGKEIYNRFPFLKNYSEEISEVLKKGETYFNNSILIDSRKDRHFNISISPLEGEKTDGVVIRVDDISNLRKIENQLIKTQKWENLGILTSGFAHDFNNVLTGIVTSSSILLHKAEDENLKLEKSFIDCLNIIDKSGKRAAAMVQQLLSLSKSNELTFTNIDLNESVEEIKSICRNSFDKSIVIETELLEKKLPVKADSAQIEQSLLNLCINSYHSMTDMRDKGEKQGGTLKISLKEINIDHFNIHTNKAIKEGDYVSITISDTGVGIPKEQKKKIFDPFYTTKEKSKGTGLGLTMVQHIVNQHNGFIELYSEPGRGTVITVFIPVSRDTSIKKIIEHKKRTPVKGRGTILIIDDEDLIRELTGSILQDCGYSVLTAENGFLGIDLYREKRDEINLIILDMSMPGISGKETFIQLKQINPEQKILMSSGFAKDDRIQDLFNMGLEDFIQKPFDFINLSEKVSKLLEQK